MTQALVPANRQRPAVVMVDGWAHLVYVHDAIYLTTVKAWKQKQAAAHPDAGGSETKFNKVTRQRIRWQCAEAKYYATLGLLPPDGFRCPEKRQQLRLRGWR